MQVEDLGGSILTPHIGVEVKFPCAPEALRMDGYRGRRCCPVTLFLDDNVVTVTLFNKQWLTERQVSIQLFLAHSLTPCLTPCLTHCLTHCLTPCFTLCLTLFFLALLLCFTFFISISAVVYVKKITAHLPLSSFICKTLPHPFSLSLHFTLFFYSKSQFDLASLALISTS